MKKLFMYLGLALVLIVGLAVTVNNVRAINTSAQVVNATQLSPSELAFQELNNKALANIGEGWLYIKEYQKHDVDPITIEGVIPLVDTNTDMWYYINSSGIVEQSITIQKTMDGKIAQVGIYSNGTSWNTTVDEIVPMEPFLFDGIHYGLPYYHLKSPDLKISNNFQGKSELMEFTITVAEKEPIKMLDYSEVLVSLEHYYAFDVSTGFLVSKKTIALLQDGTQRELDNIQIEIKPGVNPPADVLKYFEIKKNREEQK